jgi:hypothetical protein
MDMWSRVKMVAFVIFLIALALLSPAPGLALLGLAALGLVIFLIALLDAWLA